jgi:hypothetical protein
MRDCILMEKSWYIQKDETFQFADANMWFIDFDTSWIQVFITTCQSHNIKLKLK